MHNIDFELLKQAKIYIILRKHCDFVKLLTFSNLGTLEIKVNQLIYPLNE